MGQSGRTWPNSTSASRCLIRNTVFSCKAGYRVGVKLADVHLLSDISGWLPLRAPPLPAPAEHRSRETPEHRPPRSHGFSRTFANRESRVTWEASARHCQRVGSSYGRRKPNCTFYILHYMWLCTICWYPDDGVHVWNIWYLAFSRRHEMKCIIHRGNCFLKTVVTNPLCRFIFSPTIWIFKLTCWSAHTCQCQDSQWTNSTSSYRLCYWFSSYSLRAIKWK